MSSKPRRRFLKQSAALVTGMTATSCSPPGETIATASSSGLDRSLLEALARIVLPKTALGDDGVVRVASEFAAWLSRFEAVAELDHPYLWTDEIAFGPSDPAPRWQSQLEALDLEAHKRHASAYVELDGARQQEILQRQMPKDLDADLPYAGDASHVAIGLVAYFYRTSYANDLGYGASIEKQTCRGLDTAPDEPGQLGE